MILKMTAMVKAVLGAVHAAALDAPFLPCHPKWLAMAQMGVQLAAAAATAPAAAAGLVGLAQVPAVQWVDVRAQI
jgi:hypothetical protein